MMKTVHFETNIVPFIHA